MNDKLFNEMIAGFAEAKKYRKGKSTKMRVSRAAFESKDLKPAEICKGDFSRAPNRRGD